MPRAKTAKAELNDRQRKVLAALAKTEDGLTVKECCSVTGHAWGNTFLRKLWELGFVEPFEPDEGRAELWAITDAGRAALKR